VGVSVQNCVLVERGCALITVQWAHCFRELAHSYLDFPSTRQGSGGTGRASTASTERRTVPQTTWSMTVENSPERRLSNHAVVVDSICPNDGKTLVYGLLSL
jgi:hypothetical protein